MHAQFLSGFKEAFLKDVRTIIRTVSALLIVAFGLVLFAALDLVPLHPILATALRIVVPFLFILALFLLNARTPYPARLFKKLRLDLLFPAIDKMLENHEKCQANRAVIEGIKRPLGFYNLWPELHLSAAGLADEIYPRMELHDTSDARIRQVTAEVARRRRPEAEHLSAELLELLYREQHGMSIAPVPTALEDRVAPALAETLRRSQRLLPGLVCPPPCPAATDCPFCYQGDLEMLLRPIHQYSLPELNKKLSEMREQNRLVVHKMGQALRFYGLRDFNEAESWTLANAIPAVDREEERVASCARNAATNLPWSSQTYSPDLLTLLYQERFDRPVVENWRRLAPEIADMLLHSGYLPEQNGHRLDAGSLTAILQHTGDFKLETILESLNGYYAGVHVAENMLNTAVFYGLAARSEAAEPESAAEPATVVVIDALILGPGPRQRRRIGLETALVSQGAAALITCRTDKQRLERAATWLAGRLGRAGRPVSAAVLTLLYRERYAMDKVTLDPGQLRQLSRVLMDSGRLPPPAEDLPAYTDVQIRGLLDALPEFTLGGLNEAIGAFQGKRRQNLAVLTALTRVLNSYRVFPYLRAGVYQVTNNGQYQFYQRTANRLINDLPPEETLDARIRHLATKVAGYALDNPSIISAQLLELLYRERHELDRAALWTDHKAELVPGLGQLLAADGILDRLDPGNSYHPGDLATLLAPHDQFSLAFLQAELDAFGQVWRLAGEFIQFLDQNELSGWQLRFADLLSFYQARFRSLPAGEATLGQVADGALDVLIWIGHWILAVAEDGLSPARRSGLVLIALAVFLQAREGNDSVMLAAVCRRAARNEPALELAVAYLDFGADPDKAGALSPQRPVTIRYLLEHWEERVSRLRQTLPGFDDELHTVRQTLAAGEWFSQLWRLLDRTWRALRDQNVTLKNLIDQNHAAEGALRRVFRREMDVNTLDRFLESGKSHAYLLAFDSTRGSLARLIDSLLIRYRAVADFPTGRELTDEESQLRDMCQVLDDLGIRRWDDEGEQWIYNFARYTFNTRIGAVPQGWTLTEFQEELGEALIKLADRSTLDQKQILTPGFNWTGELESTEAVVHRFGLRNHFVVPLARPSETARENMLGVFAYKLDKDDLLSSTRYQLKDTPTVLEAMLAGSIVDLTAGEIDYPDPAELRALERRDGLMKEELLAALAYRTLKELSRGLVDQPDGLAPASAALSGLLQRHVRPLEAMPPRADQIATIYLETVQAIARLF